MALLNHDRCSHGCHCNRSHRRHSGGSSDNGSYNLSRRTGHSHEQDEKGQASDGHNPAVPSVEEVSQNPLPLPST